MSNLSSDNTQALCAESLVNEVRKWRTSDKPSLTLFKSFFTMQLFRDTLDIAISHESFVFSGIGYYQLTSKTILESSLRSTKFFWRQWPVNNINSSFVSFKYITDLIFRRKKNVLHSSCATEQYFTLVYLDFNWSKTLGSLFINLRSQATALAMSALVKENR